MMPICIKQHLSNTWRSNYEKVKQHWRWAEKSTAYKKMLLLEQKVSDGVANVSPRAEVTLNQREENVSQFGKITFPKKFEDVKLVEGSLRKIETPKELMLFKRRGNKHFKEKLKQFDTVNKNFENFPQNPKWKFIMDKNRVLIHIESRDIFYDNENTIARIIKLLFSFMFA